MNETLRIGVLVGPLRADAERITILDLLTALSRRGHRVRVFGDDGPLRKRFRRAGLDLALSGLTGSFIRDLPRLKRLCRTTVEEQIDILLAADPRVERHAMSVYRATGVPYAVHATRGVRGPGRPLSGCRAVLVSSPSLRDSLALPAGRVRVVPPGVDPARFPDPDPPFLGDRRILGALMPLERRSGLRDLVNAAVRLGEEGRDVHVLIAGSGPEEERLRRFARTRGAAGRVTIAEPPADLETILLTMDLVVFPGREDGQSQGILQAMAAARPVVATGVGSSFGWVREGVTGLLAPKERPEVLADRIAWMLDRPLAATEMGLAGRRAVLDGHGADRMAREVAEALREAVNGGPES